MKAFTSTVLAAVFGLMLISMGCEVSHSESTKEGLFGGTKHQETTVTKNPVTGDTNVSHSESRSNP
jgi:hypothetical protein